MSEKTGSITETSDTRRKNVAKFDKDSVININGGILARFVHPSRPLRGRVGRQKNRANNTPHNEYEQVRFPV